MDTTTWPLGIYVSLDVVSLFTNILLQLDNKLHKQIFDIHIEGGPILGTMVVNCQPDITICSLLASTLGREPG